MSPQPINPGQRAALFEAAHAATNFVSPNHRKKFVLIGGTAMLSFRSTRKTEDVDLAVSKEALYVFDSAAANNSRFKKQSGGLWEYTSNTGIIVKFDFVPVGGAVAPKLKVVEALPGSDEVRVERGEDKDATHSIRIMENAGTNLGGLTEGEYEEDFAKLLSGPVKQRALQI